MSRRQVVFTFDPVQHDRMWVFIEYVPAAVGLADDTPLAVVLQTLGTDHIEVVPVPADCTDGFASAYWRRPKRYLSLRARSNISAFARLTANQDEPGIRRLAGDLASGVWQKRQADLLTMETFDAGLRLVIGGPPARANFVQLR